MKVHLKTGRKLRIEMLPLIDIVFLLLVFFIYAMLSMAVHRSLPVSLPSSSTSGIDRDQLLSVTIKADGALYIDREMVESGRLAESLKKKARSHSEAGVMLFADRDISYQMIFSVLDQIRTAGINRISLQSEAR